jgi:probable F420-dependent oxidoreductase
VTSAVGDTTHPTVGICTYGLAGSDLAYLAPLVEAAGFESLWVGEHLVVPTVVGSAHPTRGDTLLSHESTTGPRASIVDPATVLADPIVALAAAAARTTTLRLGTAIYILPLRHPLDAARAIATLQSIAQSRFLLGVGSGWLAEEFAALDVDFATRRGRYEESIEIVRAALAGGPISHSGEFFDFADVQVSPAPVPTPLLLGGNTERAMRRAATVADGWITSGTPSLGEGLELVSRMRELVGDRRFEVFVRVPGHARSSLEFYAEHGVERLLVWSSSVLANVPRDGWEDALHEAGVDLGLRLADAPAM